MKKEMTYIEVNNKVILIIGDNWKGFPLIGYKADIILCSKMILKKFKSHFLHAMKDTTVVYLDDRKKKTPQKKALEK